MSAIVRKFTVLNYTLLLLVILTLGLLTWHHFGMDRVFVLDPLKGHEFTVSDDRGLGGKSIATLSAAGDLRVMECTLEKTYAWPFCDLAIRLAEMPDGVDLTNYESISFDVGYSGPSPRVVRFYLKNFEDNISSPSDWQSLKVNEIEFELPPSGQITIPLKLFRVASWWVSERKVPLMNTDMRIDKVPFAELSTGSLAAAGQYRFEIRAIKFNGKWISQANLLMLLVGAWLLFGVSRLLAELLEFRLHLRATRYRLRQLQSINQALKLETQELAGQVRTDQLTGALNREGLREYLMTLWQDDIPVKSGVCAIFADLDHFKIINDTYGHLAGDEVLRQFARLVQCEIRAGDRLARWGGEEFLIICPQTQADQARGLAEKLRQTIANGAWPQKMQVTCSFGVAAYIPGEDFGAMIKRADDALYKAKANGRNCAEVA